MGDCGGTSSAGGRPLGGNVGAARRDTAAGAGASAQPDALTLTASAAGGGAAAATATCRSCAVLTSPPYIMDDVTDIWLVTGLSLGMRE